MIEILIKFVDLLMIIFNGFYNLEFEFYKGQTILFGHLAIGFIFLLFAIWLLLKVLGVGEE